MKKFLSLLLTISSLKNRGIKKMAFVLCSLFLIIISCQKELSDQQKKVMANGLGKTNASMEKTDASSVHISSAVALDWYKLQLRMILNANPATNGAWNAETFAYMSIGLYELVRLGIKNSISLSNVLYQMPGMPQADNNGYDLVVSANAALASLLRNMSPWLTTANRASIDSLEKAYNQNAMVSMESEKFQRSQAYGRAVAAAVYDWAKTDNFNAGNAGYVLPAIRPWGYVSTSPNSTPIFPYVYLARPFLVENGSRVCAPPPYPYSEVIGSDFYNMVKDIYDISKVLTPEQKTEAKYWADGGISTGYTPQGHYISIAVQAVEQSGVDLGTAAEAFAKAGITERDAHLPLFRSKYLYLQIRPVSYIRKLIDPTWSPLIITPPHPEYPAAHAYISGAITRALAGVLGNIAFVDHTYDFRGFAPRPFASLDAISDECGNSRRYGGIHYMKSIIKGWSEGRALGDRVGSIKLEE